MVTACLISLAIATLALAFFLLGALRSIHRLNWRLDQLEATTPRRIGRDGVVIGAQAPSFELPETSGNSVSIGSFRGQRVLLSFMQVGCQPCHEIIPRLNRQHTKQSFAVLAIVHGSAQEVQAWTADAHPQFPILVQENWDISRRYEVFATPFAFVIDADGSVLAKGIINSADYLDLLLADAEERSRHRPVPSAPNENEVPEGALTASNA